MSASKELKPQAVIYLMYSIRDVKTNVFNTPFFQSHKAGAMRAFADLSTDPQSLIAKHPEDFQLFELGAFDSESAMLVTNDNPVYLASATDFTS